MKFKPLEKPTIVGCLNCSPVPVKTLDLDTVVDFDVFGGLSNIKTYIGEHEYYHYIDSNKNETTLQEVVKQFEKEIQICDSFCIEFSSASHGEIYEFNKEDSLFYLIKQSIGWA